MDREKKKRWQKIGVIAAETVMVLAVIAIVTVMTLVAMGYNFGKDGEIEQSGLMQLHTMPTGASVELDGNTLFARSNLSRTLSPGEHHIKISRDGYDTWEKTVTMSPGRLMRLYYPRLFATERTSELVADLDELEFYSAAGNREALLYATNNALVWNLMDIRGDEPVVAEVDISKVFGCVNEREFTGAVQEVEWADDGSRVLVNAVCNNSAEWVLVDLKDVTASINLTREFGLGFETMRLASASAGQILALENGNLRKIDVGGKSISKILIEKVAEFENHGTDVVYATVPDSAGIRYVGIYQDGAKGSVIVDTIDDMNAKLLVASSAYYDEDYLIYAVDDDLWIYEGEYPIYDATAKNNLVDLNGEKSRMILAVSTKLAVVPDELFVSRGGEFVLAKQGAVVTAVDLDMNQVSEYDAASSKVRWLDESMLYDVLDGRLVVWDYDGANQRELAEGVADKAVIISGNDRYIYYMNVDGNLMRMKILN